MTRAEFISQIRFLFHDTETSNYVRSESLTIRPENVVDGINTLFYLANRRLASFIGFINPTDNSTVSTDDYTVDLDTGMVTFGSGKAPTVPYRASYYWYKLTDSEIDKAISFAKSAGGFDPEDLEDYEVDYATLYCLAYCYQSAAGRASEYYTLSASGKQVAKSELFNHYMSLYQSTLAQAKEMRTDQKTDRGSRDEPYATDGTCDWAKPYLVDSGGG